MLLCMGDAVLLKYVGDAAMLKYMHGRCCPTLKAYAGDADAVLLEYTAEPF